MAKCTTFIIILIKNYVLLTTDNRGEKSVFREKKRFLSIYNIWILFFCALCVSEKVAKREIEGEKDIYVNYFPIFWPPEFAPPPKKKINL